MLTYILLKILSPFITHSNASAAKSSFFAALSPDVKGGEYFGPKGFMELRGKVGIAKPKHPLVSVIHCKNVQIGQDFQEASMLFAIVGLLYPIL